MSHDRRLGSFKSGGVRSLVEERFLLTTMDNDDMSSEDAEEEDGGPSQFRAFLFDGIAPKVVG
jgi:hypothetical protein